MSTPTDPLLATSEPPDLGPGPREGTRSPELLEVELTRYFKNHEVPLKSRDLVKALVLLWHDHLEAAHTIAQSVDNADGAFVHGIMHRREPDYSNAAYWFRRVGRHPAFLEIARQAARLLKSAGNQTLARDLLPDGQWDPFAFIAACERVADKAAGDAERQLIRELQRLESETLLRRLVGEGP